MYVCILSMYMHIYFKKNEMIDQVNKLHQWQKRQTDKRLTKGVRRKSYRRA